MLVNIIQCISHPSLVPGKNDPAQSVKSAAFEETALSHLYTFYCPKFPLVISWTVLEKGVRGEMENSRGPIRTKTRKREGEGLCNVRESRGKFAQTTTSLHHFFTSVTLSQASLLTYFMLCIHAGRIPKVGSLKLV